MKQDLSKEVRCRACSHLVATQYTMLSDKQDKLVYYLCGCGTIFHNEPVDYKKFNALYLSEMRKVKFFKDRLLLWQRCYLPFIEEHSYGRLALDIGFGYTEQLINMRSRGWLAEGIDLITNDYMTGDFETYDFKGRQYDFIIMSHVIASMQDPIKAIRKAVSLLHSGGLLYIAAPDTGRCIELGYGAFGHWSQENRTMTNIDFMISELTKAGMETRPILSIRNLDKRFLYFNDYHLIMRKGLCLEDAKTR